VSGAASSKFIYQPVIYSLMVIETVSKIINFC